MSGFMRSLEDLNEQQILSLLNPTEPRVRAGNPGAEMLRQMYMPPTQEPFSYDALRERLAQLRPMNVNNPPGAAMPFGMQEPESTPQALSTPTQPLTPAQAAIVGEQQPAPLPPVQERTVRPTAEVVSIPQYQPPPQAQSVTALPAPVPGPQAGPAARASSGFDFGSGNTLLGLAALTDAFAILGGRQPTMLAQMAPIAQQRSQQQALSQIIAQRTQGNLSPQQAALLGNAVQQAATTTQAPQAGEAPYGGGFSARGLAVNTQMESGGRPDARNPLSTAVGANQFIERTWLDFASANPQLFPNMDREQILAARTNPELSAQATQWNARRNGEVLQNANLPVNDATLGMAHMFGPQGARRILESRSDARIEDIVTPDVLRANPNLAGRTAGDLAQDFARRYAPTPMTPAQAQITAPSPAVPGGTPGINLRPRTVPMTPELAATLQALPPAEALKLLTQLDLQAAQQRGTRVLTAAEAQGYFASLGSPQLYDPNKAYQVTQEGGITVVPGTRESEEPTRQQRTALEGDLRTQFGAQKPVQEFLQMGPQIRAIRDGVARETPSRLNDINLTFAFAKMLDPTSVVRENEAGQIVASASVMDRLGGFIARLNGGAAFSPELRAQLLREAESRYSSAREAYDVEADAYRDLARSYGVEPGRVIPPRRDLPEARPIPGSQQAQANAVPEAQRPAVVAELTSRIQSGALTQQAARDLARQLGIPNAERLFQ
jgi:hypothetical protein